jgi:hypothetical protein
MKTICLVEQWTAELHLIEPVKAGHQTAGAKTGTANDASRSAVERPT